MEDWGDPVSWRVLLLSLGVDDDVERSRSAARRDLVELAGLLPAFAIALALVVTVYEFPLCLPSASPCRPRSSPPSARRRG